MLTRECSKITKRTIGRSSRRSSTKSLICQNLCGKLSKKRSTLWKARMNQSLLARFNFWHKSSVYPGIAELNPTGMWNTHNKCLMIVIMVWLKQKTASLNLLQKTNVLTRRKVWYCFWQDHLELVKLQLQNRLGLVSNVLLLSFQWEVKMTLFTSRVASVRTWIVSQVFLWRNCSVLNARIQWS